MKKTIILLIALVMYLSAYSVDYYVSNTGNDLYQGTSNQYPFKTFKKIPKFLNPGDRILLERGSIWNEELRVGGKGTSYSPIEITAYGTGINPAIVRTNQKTDTGIVVEDGSFWRISGIDVKNSRLGIYLRYMNSKANNTMVIENCKFENITNYQLMESFNDWNNITKELNAANGEYVWPAAVFVGGKYMSYHVDSFDTVLENIIIKNLTFNNCISGITSNWYYAFRGQGDTLSRKVTKNWYIENCSGNGFINGIFALDLAEGVVIKNVRALGGSNFKSTTGTTGAYLENCNLVLIENCEFANIKNNGSADGCGIDFEGNNRNITFKNSFIHDNEGPAILFCSTFGTNKGINIDNVTMQNNNLRPYGKEHNYEVLSWNKDNIGVITNSKIFKKNAIDYFSEDFKRGYQIYNTELKKYTENIVPVVSANKTFWLWDNQGDLEGWKNLYDWNSLYVTNGMLTGISNNNDMRIESPDFVINANDNPFVNIRFFSTLGGIAQVFFKTQEEPFFSGDKVVTFNYDTSKVTTNIVDMSQNIKWRGNITGVRFDPNFVKGAYVGIEHFSIQKR